MRGGEKRPKNSTIQVLINCILHFLKTVSPRSLEWFRTVPSGSAEKYFKYVLRFTFVAAQDETFWRRIATVKFHRPTVHYLGHRLNSIKIKLHAIQALHIAAETL